MMFEFAHHGEVMCWVEIYLWVESYYGVAKFAQVGSNFPEQLLLFIEVLAFPRLRDSRVKAKGALTHTARTRLILSNSTTSGSTQLRMAEFALEADLVSKGPVCVSIHNKTCIHNQDVEGEKRTSLNRCKLNVIFW